MSKFDREEAARVSGDLSQLADHANTRINTLRCDYPDWHRDEDARISGFAKISNVTTSVALGLKFYRDQLIDPAWWSTNTNGTFSAEDKQRINRAYVDLVKIGLIQIGFSAVESTLRDLLRAIDPAACAGGTEGFESIYKCLFRSKLSSVPADGCELLDLLREVRNTVHNNGVYFNRRGQDLPVIYKGDTYDFRHRQKVDFLTWDLLISLYRDVCDLLYHVVTDSVVTGISGGIRDSYA